MVLEAVLLAQMICPSEGMVPLNGGPTCVPIGTPMDHMNNSLPVTASIARCKDGWTLVLLNNVPKCAKEIEQPDWR